MKCVVDCKQHASKIVYVVQSNSQADAQHAMPLPGVAIARVSFLLQRTS